MEKRHALLLSLLLTLLIASNIYLLKPSEHKRKTVLVTRVIDGDTIEVNNAQQLRLLNINTPEKNEHGYKEALIFLKQFENKTIEIEELATDKYKRTLARLYTPSYLNLELISQGLANKFLVNEAELKEFSSAEELAIKESKGIWKKSFYYGCFQSSINAKEETIFIKSTCNPINTTNWIISDESRKAYIFPYFSLNKITIHSYHGKNNKTDLYWNSNQNIWNNNRDTLYLFDSEKKLAHYQSYGY